MSKSADAFRTISEVADWLGVHAHVLRFWESKFTQIKPVKRAGGRRYYRPVDMLLLGGIQKLLHEDGLTIKGVQKILREKGMAHVSALSKSLDDAATMENIADVPLSKPIAPAPAIPEAPSAMDVAPDESTNIVDFVSTEPQSESPSAPEASPEEPERPSFTDDAVVMPDQQNPDAPVSDESADAPVEAVEQLATPDIPDMPAVDTVELSEAAQDVAPNPPADESAVVADVSDEEMGVTAQPTPPLSDNVEPVDTLEGVAEISAAEDTLAQPEADQDDSHLRMFMSESAKQVEAAEQVADAPESSPTPEVSLGSEPATQDTPDIPVLPAFLHRPAPQQAEPEPTPESLQTLSEQLPVPKPNIVDAPDPPDEADIDAAPGLLSLMSKTTSLDPQKADAIMPLLAQLAAARDRMALARKE